MVGVAVLAASAVQAGHPWAVAMAPHHDGCSRTRARAGATPLPDLVSELWRLAWPAVVRMLLSCGCDRLTLAMVGHWDEKIAQRNGTQQGPQPTKLILREATAVRRHRLAASTLGLGRRRDRHAHFVEHKRTQRQRRFKIELLGRSIDAAGPARGPRWGGQGACARCTPSPWWLLSEECPGGLCEPTP